MRLWRSVVSTVRSTPSPVARRRVVLALPMPPDSRQSSYDEIISPVFVVQRITLTDTHWAHLVRTRGFVPQAVLELDWGDRPSTRRHARSLAKSDRAAWLPSKLLQTRRPRWRWNRSISWLSTRLVLACSLAACGVGALVLAAVLDRWTRPSESLAGLLFGLALVFGIEQPLLDRERRKQRLRAIHSSLVRLEIAVRGVGLDVVQHLHMPGVLMTSVAFDFLPIFDCRVSDMRDLRRIATLYGHLDERRLVDWERWSLVSNKGVPPSVSWGDGRVTSVTVLAQLARLQASSCAIAAAYAKEAAELLETPALLIPAARLAVTGAGIAKLADNASLYHELASSDPSASHHARYTPGQHDAAQHAEREGTAYVPASPDEELQWVSAELLRHAADAWSQVLDVARVVIVESERADGSPWDRIKWRLLPPWPNDQEWTWSQPRDRFLE